MYMITPRDHMSHDLSYFSGPRTSGAETDRERARKKNTHWNANQIWVPPPNLAWYIYLIRFKMPQLNIKPTKEEKKKSTHEKIYPEKPSWLFEQSRLTYQKTLNIIRESFWPAERFWISCCEDVDLTVDELNCRLWSWGNDLLYGRMPSQERKYATPSNFDQVPPPIFSLI